MMLLTCFKRITDAQASQLTNKTEEEIDPLTDEHLNLLQLEKWSTLYESKDSKGLAAAFKEISDTAKEIKVS
jgi:hypothetical protein